MVGALGTIVAATKTNQIIQINNNEWEHWTSLI
jgi:hypothetical protein